MAGNSKRQLSKVSAVYIALGVLLIAVMTTAGTSAFMGTTGFIVDGASIYTVEEIVEASGLSVGDNLLFISTSNSSLNIRDALPFVNTVEITRKLPDTIYIKITESTAIANIFFAGEYYIIDSSGRLLERLGSTEDTLGAVASGNLIEIRGVEIEETMVGKNLRSVFGAETKLQYMLDVLTGLEREGLENDVSFLDVSNIVNVHFGYLGIYNVILSGTTNLRPANIRHNLSTLAENVEEVVKYFPNTPGDIIYEESGPPRFIPR